MQMESSTIVIGPPFVPYSQAYNDDHGSNENTANNVNNLDSDLSRRADILLLSQQQQPPPYYHGGNTHNSDNNSNAPMVEDSFLRRMRWLPVAIVVYIILANFALTVIVLVQLVAFKSNNQLGHDTISQRIGTLNQTAWALSEHTDNVDSELYQLVFAMNMVGEAMNTLHEENILIFNSTERSRHGLLLLVKLLEQILQPTN